MISDLNRMTLFLTVLYIWSVSWKGVALWKAAAQKKDVYWFVALLLLNTAGILEMLYLFVFSKMDWKKILSGIKNSHHML